MRLLIFTFLFAFTVLPSYSAEKETPSLSKLHEPKKFDLVLVHGLANKHKWSNSFLNTCLEIWGTERVFVVYTGPEITVTTKEIQGRKLIIGGGEGEAAGTGSLDSQVANLTATVKILQEEHGLDETFSIIAHSTGGLVSRQYSYSNPGRVAGLVTLGTPHRGSPLANSFQWVGFFLTATDAIEDLKPENMVRFNQKYPVASTPLANSDTIHTIRGIPDGTECYGWMGELFFGWHILFRMYNTENDGLVPSDSAIIKGAKHIADFSHYDHYDVVREPEVAKAAAEYLP